MKRNPRLTLIHGLGLGTEERKQDLFLRWVLTEDENLLEAFRTVAARRRQCRPSFWIVEDSGSLRPVVPRFPEDEEEADSEDNDSSTWP